MPFVKVLIDQQVSKSEGVVRREMGATKMQEKGLEDFEALTNGRGSM